MVAQYDVVVLGAGIAGAAAALAASGAGARVAMIAGPPGATALFSGAWRGPCPSDLREALAAVGYDLAECHQPLPHASGVLLTCDYACRSHAHARLRANSLVCGIAGLPAFDAPALALQWSARSGVPLRSANLLLSATPATGWAAASLAGHIARDPLGFARALADLASEHGADHVVLPAVLGTIADGVVHQAVEDATHCTVGEALAVAPSLPGWRLHNALQRALANARVSIVAGRAHAHEQTAGRLQSVQTGEEVLSARAFVLATGKFVAGGIEANAEFLEPALQCPVWVEHLGEIFETPDPLLLTDAERTEAQPLLRAGVHVDEQRRPISQAKEAVYANVFATGSVRAGWDNVTHGIGECAEDGWRAGLAAVKA